MEGGASYVYIGDFDITVVVTMVCRHWVLCSSADVVSTYGILVDLRERSIPTVWLLLG